MKAIRLHFISVVAAIGTFGYGTIGLPQGFVFNNMGGNGGARAAVYGPDPLNPYLRLWGNGADATPAGTQLYFGAPLDSNYAVQAWYSLSPVDDVLAVLPSATIVSGSRTSFRPGVPGYFSRGDLTISDA